MKGAAHLSSLQDIILGKHCRLTGRDWQRASVRFEAQQMALKREEGKGSEEEQACHGQTPTTPMLSGFHTKGWLWPARLEMMKVCQHGYNVNQRRERPGFDALYGALLVISEMLTSEVGPARIPP